MDAGKSGGRKAHGGKAASSAGGDGMWAGRPETRPCPIPAPFPLCLLCSAQSGGAWNRPWKGPARRLVFRCRRGPFQVAGSGLPAARDFLGMRRSAGSPGAALFLRMLCPRAARYRGCSGRLDVVRSIYLERIWCGVTTVGTGCNDCPIPPLQPCLRMCITPKHRECLEVGQNCPLPPPMRGGWRRYGHSSRRALRSPGIPRTLIFAGCRHERTCKIATDLRSLRIGGHFL